MVAQTLGSLVGWFPALALRLLERMRRKRAVHAHGHCVRAFVQPHPRAEGGFQDIADRLAGPALVRLSSTLWRKHERMDGLGCAIRNPRLPPNNLTVPAG